MCEALKELFANDLKELFADDFKESELKAETLAKSNLP